jgi:hypothetical protein
MEQDSEFGKQLLIGFGARLMDVLPAGEAGAM